MTKHFAEEEGSCFLGEKVYTLKELIEMERSYTPPKPNNITVEQAFDIMFEKYENALEELSKK